MSFLGLSSWFILLICGSGVAGRCCPSFGMMPLALRISVSEGLIGIFVKN
jgi:hypothetical protein